MMKIESTTKNSIERDSKLLRKRFEHKALTYILTVNILFLMIVGIAFFSVPKMIHAYAVSKNNKTDFAMDRAEKTMINYRNVSLTPFEEEERTLEDHFNIFPAPSYPEEISSTAGRWCTFFAQMWFYDQFGFNSSGNTPTGSGAQFASTVYQTAVYYDEEGVLQHYFEYGDKPMTMGIVSVSNSYNPEGHVLCVDEVDYLNDTITISEGNAYGSGDVRIRHTMSLSQFYALNPGYRVYVNPTPELINMIKGN